MTDRINHTLKEKGFCHLQDKISASMLKNIEADFQLMSTHATSILHDIQRQELSYADYYAQKKTLLLQYQKQITLLKYVVSNI